MLFAGGWWIAIVELWPAASRPYIGGSQNNSIRELTLGYNGLGRLGGNEVGSVWFFDTELLVVAERAGLRIHEVPVDWSDDPESSVDIVRTVVNDLLGMAWLGSSLLQGTLPLREIGQRLGRTSTAAGRGRLGLQVAVFSMIGLVSTLAYALVYLGLRPAMSPGWANLLALLVTTVGNTGANRRFTFGVRGRRDAVRHQL